MTILAGDPQVEDGVNDSRGSHSSIQAVYEVPRRRDCQVVTSRGLDQRACPRIGEEDSHVAIVWIGNAVSDPQAIDGLDGPPRAHRPIE